MDAKELVATHVMQNMTAMIEDMFAEDGSFARMLNDVRFRHDYVTPAQNEGWGPAESEEADHTFENGHGEISYQRDWESLCREQGIESEIDSPMEFYLVSAWLAERLKRKNQLIATNFYGMCIWGRCTSGQSVKMDSVIQEIANES